MGYFGKEYLSLRNISFLKLDTVQLKGTGIAESSSDDEIRVEVVISNSAGRKFEFASTAKSLGAATVRVVFEAITYFVNSERAFMAYRRWLEDARERNRIDLVQEIVGNMALMVENAACSKVLEARSS